MTLSLAAVFIPLLFMGGVLGRLFREFAVTICVAILISGVVSVTLTPMLCSRFLQPPHEQKHGVVLPDHGAVLRMDAARSTTSRCSACCVIRAGHDGDVRHRAGAPPVYMFMDHPEGLHSGPGHRPDLRRSREAAQGTSFYQMVEYQKQIADDRAPESQYRGADVDRGRDVGIHAGRPEFRASWWCT